MAATTFMESSRIFRDQLDSSFRQTVETSFQDFVLSIDKIKIENETENTVQCCFSTENLIDYESERKIVKNDSVLETGKHQANCKSEDVKVSGLLKLETKRKKPPRSKNKNKRTTDNLADQSLAKKSVINAPDDAQLLNTGGSLKLDAKAKGPSNGKNNLATYHLADQPLAKESVINAPEDSQLLNTGDSLKLDTKQKGPGKMKSNFTTDNLAELSLAKESTTNAPEDAQLMDTKHKGPDKRKDKLTTDNLAEKPLSKAINVSEDAQILDTEFLGITQGLKSVDITHTNDKSKDENKNLNEAIIGESQLVYESVPNHDEICTVFVSTENDSAKIELDQELNNDSVKTELDQELNSETEICEKLKSWESMLFKMWTMVDSDHIELSIFFCGICNYSTQIQKEWNSHLSIINHRKNYSGAVVFICDSCSLTLIIEEKYKLIFVNSELHIGLDNKVKRFIELNKSRQSTLDMTDEESVQEFEISAHYSLETNIKPEIKIETVTSSKTITDSQKITDNSQIIKENLVDKDASLQPKTKNLDNRFRTICSKFEKGILPEFGYCSFCYAIIFDRDEWLAHPSKHNKKGIKSDDCTINCPEMCCEIFCLEEEIGKQYLKQHWGISHKSKKLIYDDSFGNKGLTFLTKVNACFVEGEINGTRIINGFKNIWRHLYCLHCHNMIYGLRDWHEHIKTVRTKINGHKLTCPKCESQFFSLDLKTGTNYLDFHLKATHKIDSSVAPEEFLKTNNDGLKSQNQGNESNESTIHTNFKPLTKSEKIYYFCTLCSFITSGNNIKLFESHIAKHDIVEKGVCLNCSHCDCQIYSNNITIARYHLTLHGKVHLNKPKESPLKSKESPLKTKGSPLKSKEPPLKSKEPPLKSKESLISAASSEKLPTSQKVLPSSSKVASLDVKAEHSLIISSQNKFDKSLNQYWSDQKNWKADKKSVCVECLTLVPQKLWNSHVDMHKKTATGLILACDFCYCQFFSFSSRSYYYFDLHVSICHSPKKGSDQYFTEDTKNIAAKNSNSSVVFDNTNIFNGFITICEQFYNEVISEIYFCRLCQTFLNTKKLLENHILRKHEEGSTSTCTYCECEIYPNDKIAHSYMKYHHEICHSAKSDNIAKLFIQLCCKFNLNFIQNYCDICNELINDWDVHLTEHAESKFKWISCSVCEMKILSNSSPLRYLKYHMEENHKNSQLKLPKVIRNKRRPKLSNCNQTFIEIMEKKNNRLASSSEPSFDGLCLLCNSTFIDRFEWMDHLDSHTGNKESTCKKCLLSCYGTDDDCNQCLQHPLHLNLDSNF